MKKAFLILSIIGLSLGAAQAQKANKGQPGDCCMKNGKQSGMHKGRMGQGMQHDRMNKQFADLNLTQEQKNQLQALREDGRKHMESFRKDQESKRNAILTPEQREKWGKMKHANRDRFMHGDRKMARHTMRHENMMAKLDLTQAQKDKLQAMRESGRKEIALIRNNDKLTQEQKRDQIKSFRNAQKAKRDAIFTLEQKKKLDQFKNQKPIERVGERIM